MSLRKGKAFWSEKKTKRESWVNHFPLPTNELHSLLHNINAIDFITAIINGTLILRVRVSFQFEKLWKISFITHHISGRRKPSFQEYTWWIMSIMLGKTSLLFLFFLVTEKHIYYKWFVALFSGKNLTSK